MNYRHAFTLIELLVVIGIIGVLTTLLMPALIGIREEVQRIACQNNIRTLVLANASYAAVNSERYALAADGMNEDNLRRWFGEREDVNQPFNMSGPLSGYLPGGLLKACGSFTDFAQTAGQDAAFESGCGGYGYNDLYIGGRFDLYKSVRDNDDNFKRGYGKSAATGSPAQGAETVMFTDTAFNRGGVGTMAYSFTHAPKWVPAQPYGGGAPDPSIHFRHKGRANVAWVDTHVSSEPMTFAPDRTPEAGEISPEEAMDLELGWFGDYFKRLPDANYLFDLD